MSEEARVNPPWQNQSWQHVAIRVPGWGVEGSGLATPHEITAGLQVIVLEQGNPKGWRPLPHVQLNSSGLNGREVTLAEPERQVFAEHAGGIMRASALLAPLQR